MDRVQRWSGIEAFVAVAECGGFSLRRSGSACPPSHVSRQVAALEERLQTWLFYRSTRQVALTEIGKTFCSTAVSCRKATTRRCESSTTWAGTKGLLRMTCAVAYGERFVVPLENEFMAMHSQLRLEIELTNQTRDILQDGFDLAIRLGRLSDSRLVGTRIAPRVMYLCAAPSYLERHGAPHSLSELAHHDCLVGTSDNWVFQAGGREVMQRVQGKWRCNSGQAVLDAALRGFGLCQLPDYYVLEHLASGALRALLPALQPPNTAVWAVYPQRRHRRRRFSCWCSI